MRPKFIDRSGNPHREELARQLEEVHPPVSPRKLGLALLREQLRRKMRKVEERLKEGGL
jgi:hypothetical protein